MGLSRRVRPDLLASALHSLITHSGVMGTMAQPPGKTHVAKNEAPYSRWTCKQILQTRQAYQVTTTSQERKNCSSKLLPNSWGSEMMMQEIWGNCSCGHEWVIYIEFSIISWVFFFLLLKAAWQHLWLVFCNHRRIFWLLPPAKSLNIVFFSTPKSTSQVCSYWADVHRILRLPI